MRRKKNNFPSEAGITVESVSAELDRVKYKDRYRSTFRSTIYILIVVAAVTVLLATTIIPVFRTYGDSMTPALSEGELVLSFKGSSFETGDIVGLYVGNKLLVKRVIAGPGQWVDIKEDGTVFIDGKEVEEPYVSEKAFGDCNIELPYQVPDGRYFVMGDHRSTSLDSRNTAVGCIAEEQVVGKVIFRVWPLNRIGVIRSENIIAVGE